MIECVHKWVSAEGDEFPLHLDLGRCDRCWIPRHGPEHARQLEARVSDLEDTIDLAWARRIWAQDYPEPEDMKRAAEVLKGDRGAARHRLGGNAVIGGLDRSREPARGL